MSYFDHPNYRKSFVSKYGIEQAAEAIRNGLIKISKEQGSKIDPPDDAIAKLLAQSRLETGHFAHCYNHNWGNVKRSPDKGAFHMIRCNEKLDGEWEWFDPPHIQTCFAAYNTQMDGAMHWMRLIITHPRYEKARQKLYDGKISAYDFCWTLGECGYFTANKHSYSTVVQNLYASSLDAALASQGKKPVEQELRLLMLTDPPMTGEDVKEWQGSLNQRGFALNVDGSYGPKTAGDTKKFQSRNGLFPDGKVGADTRSAMKRLLDEPISSSRLLKLTDPYMSGTDITGLQVGLLKLGYQVKVDGTFGPNTDSTVRIFQTEFSLKVDGVVGSKTLSVLENEIDALD